MRVRRVSEVTPRTCSWLWPGRLALGKLAMLDGDPGLGKSLLALDLCARLSTGRPMPDGSPGPGVCSSLVLNAEDGTDDTVRPRLQTLGADLERVFVPEKTDRLNELRLPSQVALLEEALQQSQARLLVLDPVLAFLEERAVSTTDQAVRQVLTPLAQLAEKYTCAVWFVRHLTKRGGARALYRGGGSIGLLAACRSGWLLATNPQEPRQRVLAQVKNNLAPRQPSLAFEVRPREGAPPELCWLGESALTADELLGGANRYAAPELDRARAFLKEFLQSGPRTARAIWQAAVKEDLSKRTLQRARAELDIRFQWTSVNGVPRTYWLLPTQELSQVEPQAPASLEPWLKPLREKYPPRTPLEEDDP